MKKNHFISLILLQMIVLTPAGKSVQAVEICGSTEKLDVDGKTYVVQNNIWGASTAQCVNVDGTSFEVTKSEHNMPTNDAPASYPCIFRGCHWGDCTNNSGMPITVGEIESVPSSWSISTPGSGAWNAAYDIWFHTSSSTSGQPDAAEIMIWINSMGGVQPAGSIIANNVSIEGASWDVWFYTGFGWNYIAYERTSVTTSVDFDLNGFFKDAKSRGYLENQWYLIDVEAGFEIWQGGVGLKTNSFSCTIGGDTPTGYTLNVTINGSGDVDLSPDQSKYDSGTSVTLTANPSSGYIFTGWSGDISGTENPAQLIMDSNKNVTANFEVSTQEPPTVSITSPSQGETFDQGEAITISADASDSDGSVTKVKFLVNGSVVGEDSSSPYSITWTATTAGNHSITAKATDNDGASTISSAVNITVESGTGPDGENLALNKPVSASSVEDNGLEAENAVDGNTDSRWSSDFSDPQWIRVDLQSTYTINRVVISWESAHASDYDIQVSNDGNNWTTVASVTGSDGGEDDVFFSDTDARYVRIYGTQRSTDYGYSLYEIEIYGPTTSISPDINLARELEQNKISLNLKSTGQGNIKFRLSSPTYISLNILNTKGSKVATVFNGFLGKGVHRINFQTHSLSWGIYLIRLKGEKSIISSKFIKM